MVKKQFDGLTNLELIQIANKNGIKLDSVLMINELTNNIPHGKWNIILNLQPTGSSGSHWVLFVVRNNTAVYIDSYGAIPPEDVMQYCKSMRIKLGYSAYICQSLASKRCGYYCLQGIEYLQKANSSNLLEKANQYINHYEPLFQKTNESIVMTGF